MSMHQFVLQILTNAVFHSTMIQIQALVFPVLQNTKIVQLATQLLALCVYKTLLGIVQYSTIILAPTLVNVFIKLAQ